MKRIKYIIQKEFLQLKRDKQILPMIFLIPIIQLLILANAATFEIKKVKLAVIDKDMSSYSRELISEIQGTNFFIVKNFYYSQKQANNAILEDKVDAIIEIPHDFEKNLTNYHNDKIFIKINAINQNAASLTHFYLSSIINDFKLKKMKQNFNYSTRNYKSIIPQALYWYNPEMNYKYYMVPGILSILLTIIGMFLTSMAIVKEREIGTIEQINVTPITKMEFILGKLIPIWIIGNFEMAFGLSLGKLLFNIPIEAPLWLIFLSVAIYLIVPLGFGLFISSITHTQQQAMFISYFFMVIFILMSGLFTPTISMPHWAQIINIFNPLMYFIKIMRMLFLKGSNLSQILPPLLSLVIYGILILTLAIKKYKKTM